MTLSLTTWRRALRPDDDDDTGAANPVNTSPPFFVRQQYLDFLSREPDTNGFKAWLGVLSGCADHNTGPGVPPRCDRIFVPGEGFFRSQEFDNAFVAMQYYGSINRKPDPDGFNDWLPVLQAGDARTMVNGFLNSAEYKLRCG